MLPTDFNIGTSGLEMNSGALQATGSVSLLGMSKWTGGSLESAGTTAANLIILASILIPAPSIERNPIEAPLDNEMNFIVENHAIATVDATGAKVQINFAKDAGVTVNTGGIFKFIGSDKTILGAAGQQSGAFVVDGGDCWVNMQADGEVQMNLNFQQEGPFPQTIVAGGTLSLLEDNADSYVAVITSGKVEVYGDATLNVSGLLGASNGILFQDGATLIASYAVDATPAIITGSVVMEEGSNITFGGFTQGAGGLLITGDLNLNGILSITVDFNAFPTSDAIHVNGNTTLGNKSALKVVSVGPFAKNNTCSAIVSVGGLANTFASVNLPKNFTTNYTMTHVEIKI